MHRCLLALLLLPALASADGSRIAPIEAAVDSLEWKDAIKLAEKWVDSEPRNALAQYWLAVALRTKMQEVNRLRAMATVGDYKDALAAAIALDPTLMAARTERIGYLVNAPGIAGGDRDLARKEIEALREIDPVAAAEMDLMLAREESNADATLAALSSLQALEPDRAQHRLAAALLHINRQSWDEEEALLVSCADSKEPGVALGALYQRSRWRIIAKQDTQVAEELMADYLTLRGEDVLPHAPNRAAAYWRLGLAQELNGDDAAALASLEMSVDLNDEFEPAVDDLERLKRRR